MQDVQIIHPYTEGRAYWIGLADEGYRRKVFRVIDQELCGSRHLVAGITIFPQGESSSLHDHPDSEEMDLILSGTGEVVWGDGRARKAFGPHSVIFIPKGVAHQHRNTGNEPLVLMWCYTPPGENPSR